MNRQGPNEPVSRSNTAQNRESEIHGYKEGTNIRVRNEGNQSPISEEELTGLVRKFTMEGKVKPKCRLLQQAIFSYFTGLKSQITGSIDSLCKNVINHVGYPFLFMTNNLSAYKKLKNKEFKRVTAAEAQNFYEHAGHITQQQLVQQEKTIYLEQVEQVRNLLCSIDDILNSYQALLKQFGAQHNRDQSLGSKVNDLIASVLQKNASPSNSSPSSRSPTTVNSPVPSFLSQPRDNNPAARKVVTEQTGGATTFRSTMGTSVNQSKELGQQSMMLRQDPIMTRPDPIMARPEVSIIRPTPVQVARSPLTDESKNIWKPKHGREVSLDKNIQEHHFKKQKERSSPVTPNLNLKERKTFKEIPITDVPKLGKFDSLRQQLDSKELQINNKKKMLMNLMGNKEKDSPTPQRTRPAAHSVDRGHSTPRPFGVESLIKRVDKEQQQLNESHQLAFSQLPMQQNPKEVKKPEGGGKIKGLVIATDLIEKDGPEAKPKQVSSPLYKKHQQISNQARLDQLRDQIFSSMGSSETPSDSPTLPPVSTELDDDEQKSLALLLRGMKLPASKAIAFMQAAIRMAQNNFSAGQYLSYLYLQEGRARDCIKVCDEMLELIEDSPDRQRLGLHLFINKAAALNVVGRYSESIVLLETITQPNDVLLKNLGDAYSSIGLWERAIGPYQRATKLNPSLDEAFYNLAVCHMRMGQLRRARMSIVRALQHQPTHPEYQELSKVIESSLRRPQK